METTDEFAVPPRPALVHPDADGVRTPSALGPLSPEDPPPAFMERDWRHGGDNTAAYPGCSPFQPSAAGRPVSISLPASPTGGFDISSRTEAELQRDAAAVTDAPPPRMMMLPPFAPAPAMALEQPGKVVFRSQPIPAAPPVGDGGHDDEFGRSAPAAMALEQPGKVVFRSQPIIPGAPPEGDGAARGHDDFGRSAPAAKTRRDSRDTSYDSFKTWSGKLEKQIATHLLGSSLQQQPEHGEEPEEDDAASDRRNSSMPKVQRFFAALEGPELDKLRSSEELILPSDKTWPFLLRFPVSAFGMCLGMSSQAILWKRIAISASTRFLHITVKINLVLWCASVALMAAVSALYGCKLVLYFEAVRREYYHPIRVNFFFAPWIACLFLAIGVPDVVAATLPHWLWYVLMAPIVCLELKIYGQWISGGQRRLSRVANPSNHLSIVGNFVGALLGGIMGLKEGPMFFFSVGLAHYMVLFVTLYQRLPTSETLPRDLHPVFFLFVAAPSVACLAWARITGEFGYGSRVAYFIAMFLYASLAVRINLFRGFSFSLAWWAYTFPMTSAAIASIRYSSEVKNAFTQCMCIGLAAAATLAVAALFLATLLHAVVYRDLFPNDISIAITERRRSKPLVGEKMLLRLRSGKKVQQALSTAPADAAADLEAARAATTTSYT
ncbi:S-type anion channel SLAH3 isoform X2 [Zea mays]|nr:S-type anion channel SLAH3 isoform X2 [Zea mays]|eukprot:XP_008673492.1 S-type anion channel SLAH3 isoform X2 [Zea mays]